MNSDSMFNSNQQSVDAVGTLLKRSHKLMQSEDTALVVIDVQEKIIQAIANQHEVVWNIRRLVDAANLLCIDIKFTEQYPQRLGKTIELVSKSINRDAIAKMAFSCIECIEIFEQLRKAGREKLLLCGVEAHVCVQQSALDLLFNNFDVYVAVDAIGSRHKNDYEIALKRMDSAGATLTTTESVLFEWCQTSARAEFKSISNLVKENRPYS